MAEVLNELGLVDTYGPEPHPNPEMLQQSRQTCNDGRAFTPEERAAWAANLR